MTHVKPTPAGFTVALDALQHDAELWDGSGGTQGSSQQLRQAENRAMNLPLHGPMMGLSVELTWAYISAWDLFVDRAQDGAFAHQYLGDALRDARTTYLRADEAAMHDRNQTW